MGASEHLSNIPPALWKSKNHEIYAAFRVGLRNNEIFIRLKIKCELKEVAPGLRKGLANDLQFNFK